MGNKNDSDKLLWQYAGLATQLLISLGLSMYIGYWLDHKLGWQGNFLVWILPLIVLVATLFKLIRDTSKKK